MASANGIPFPVVVVSTAGTGLQAAYGFDEGSGGTAADASGNGNRATLSGVTWTTGKYGSALSLSGTSQFATVPSSPTLNLTTGTLEAWVRFTSINRWNGVIAKGDVNQDARHNYAIEIDDTNRVTCEVGNGSTFNIVKSFNTVVTGQFYHLACTWDGAQLRLYINGALNRSAAQTITPASNTAPLSIGQYGGSVDRFAGRIDEVRIYNVALSQTLIQADMNTAVTQPADTTPPVRSAGSPSGTLAAGTTQTTLSLVTDEAATCRYGTAPNVAYGALPNAFAATGGTSHSTLITGLTDGSSYTYYVRCSDVAANADASDYAIAFAIAKPADTTPPMRSAGSPSGTLAAGTTQTTLSLVTDEAATCRYGTAPNVAYGALPNVFATTGSTSHSTAVSGLTDGSSYTYYVRCSDVAGNADASDYAIAFAIAKPADTTPPMRSAGSPSGTLAAGTTQTTLSLVTDEAATCRYGTAANLAYSALPNAFAATGGTSHSTLVTGLADGSSYTYYVRCSDVAGNADANDYAIAFAVAKPADTTPPVRSAGSPSGTLAAGTTQTTLSLVTDEAATCRYGTAPNVAYGALPNAFATTGGTSHSTPVTRTRPTAAATPITCAAATSRATPMPMTTRSRLPSRSRLTRRRRCDPRGRRAERSPRARRKRR